MAAAASALVQSGESFASGNIAGGVTSLVSGAISELTQHTARLKGATNENEAVATVVPAFDADIQSINQAYNAGKVNKATAVAALQAVSQNMYAYLHSLVGAAGTAWRAGGGACDKGCTVSCCIYYEDLLPSVNNAIAALNAGGNGQQSQVNEVFGDKYGLAQRNGYALTWNQTPVGNVQASLTATIDELLGKSPIAGVASSTPNVSPLLLVVMFIFFAVAFVFALGSK